MKLLIQILVLLLPAYSIAQQNPYMELWNKEQIDSLRLIWNKTTNDTVRMAAARSLGFYYQERNRDSGLYFNEQQALLARQLKLRLWEGDALDQIGCVTAGLKDYGRSLQAFLDGLEILKDKEAEKNIWRLSIFSKEGNPGIARLTAVGYIHNDLSILYLGTGNFQEAISNLQQAIKINERINFPSLLSDANGNLGRAYINLNKLDSALIFTQKAIHFSNVSEMQKNKGGWLYNIGVIYQKKGNTDLPNNTLPNLLRLASNKII